MVDNRTETIAKDKVGKVGETADERNGYHQRDSAETLIPMSIVELTMMLILHLTEEQLAHNAKDVNRSNYNRSGGNDCKGMTEEITVAEHRIVDGGVFERAEEDGHFSHKSAQSGQSQRCQTGNDITHLEERPNLHQASHLAHVASVSTAINHTYKGEEESRHQAVRKHLHHSTAHCSLIEHQDSEKHQAAV